MPRTQPSGDARLHNDNQAKAKTMMARAAKPAAGMAAGTAKSVKCIDNPEMSNGRKAGKSFVQYAGRAASVASAFSGDATKAFTTPILTPLKVINKAADAVTAAGRRNRIDVCDQCMPHDVAPCSGGTRESPAPRSWFRTCRQSAQPPMGEPREPDSASCCVSTVSRFRHKRERSLAPDGAVTVHSRRGLAHFLGVQRDSSGQMRTEKCA